MQNGERRKSIPTFITHWPIDRDTSCLGSLRFVSMQSTKLLTPHPSQRTSLFKPHSRIQRDRFPASRKNIPNDAHPFI